MAEPDTCGADRGDVRRADDLVGRSSRYASPARRQTVDEVVENFTSVVVCDFEYEVADGELPRVLCMVAEVLDENLKHVRTIKLWRGEFGAAAPFNTGPHTLFVAYSAWAEMQCFLTLGWKFPTHIFDQHTAYLAASNVLLPYEPDEIRTKPRKRLADACQAYDLEGWRGIDKEAYRARP